MTPRKKTVTGRLRITQVHSIIGNQDRVKRVVTDGLGLGRIGSSVVLPDNPYTRGMIAKTTHIVKFEELAAEAHAARVEETEATPHETEAPAHPEVKGAEKAPRKPRAATKAAKPAAPRKRAAAKNKE